MKLLYMPFSILAGLIGARVGRKAFQSTWSRLSDGPQPTPGAEGEDLGRVVLAAALQGAILGGAVAVSNHFAARTFHHLFGVWPRGHRQTQEPAAEV